MGEQDDFKENDKTDNISKGEIISTKVEYLSKHQDLLFEQSDSAFELGGYVNCYFD